MTEKVTRRRMLDAMLGFGAVGVMFVTAWPLLKFTVPPKKAVESGEWIDAGTVSEITSAGYKDILGPTGQPVILVADEGGKIQALEKKCPHLGCMVSLGKGELDCPCHGAKFTLEGKLISGPSPRGLKRYAVEVRGGTQVFVGKEQG